MENQNTSGTTASGQAPDPSSSQTMQIDVAVVGGFNLPAYIVPGYTTHDTSQSATANEGVRTLQLLDYGKEAIVAYLVGCWAFKEADAQAEADQGFPMLAQNADWYKRIVKGTVVRRNGTIHENTDWASVDVAFADGATVHIGDGK